jgi:hypothetical protein
MIFQAIFPRSEFDLRILAMRTSRGNSLPWRGFPALTMIVRRIDTQAFDPCIYTPAPDPDEPWISQFTEICDGRGILLLKKLYYEPPAFDFNQVEFGEKVCPPADLDPYAFAMARDRIARMLLEKRGTSCRRSASPENLQPASAKTETWRDRPPLL